MCVQTARMGISTVSPAGRGCFLTTANASVTVHPKLTPMNKKYVLNAPHSALNVSISTITLV